MVRKNQTVHNVYPGDLADNVEQLADKRGTSISGIYKEAIRRELSREQTREKQDE